MAFGVCNSLQLHYQGNSIVLTSKEFSSILGDRRLRETVIVQFLCKHGVPLPCQQPKDCLKKTKQKTKCVSTLPYRERGALGLVGLYDVRLAHCIFRYIV